MLIYLRSLDWNFKPPPISARRDNPSAIKVFLLLGKRGTSKKGSGAAKRAKYGMPAFEPKNIPATQAQLI